MLNCKNVKITFAAARVMDHIPMKRTGRVTAGLVLASIAVGLNLTVARAEAPSDSAFLINPGTYRSVAGYALNSPDAVEQFYRSRNNKPAWVSGTSPALKNLLGIENVVQSHGLSAGDYHLAVLPELIEKGNRQAVELLATDAFLTFGAHLLRGKVDPVALDPNWTAVRRSGELIAVLSKVISSGEVTKSVELFAPKSTAYRVLQEALKRLRKSGSMGFPKIPDGPALKLGMKGKRVAILRARLAAEELLAMSSKNTGDVFDHATELAVAAFQRVAGLEADGVVGSVTRREMNRSFADRILQIRVNLERWRWLAEDLGTRHIRVNIAAFSLETWNRGALVRKHDVIVGRPYRKTPVFSGEMSYLILNPWWETPHNIARLDKLPDLQRDPAFADRLGFEIFDRAGKKIDPLEVNWGAYTPKNFPFRLRQRPSPQNALGEVKLMFPNHHNVYLHGTPARELFSRTRRDFSSGCIRVQQVLDLTEWVLSDTPGWDRRKIESVVASGQVTRIDLRLKIPVHILYLTAVATDEGSVRFLPDIYDRDSRLAAALEMPPLNKR